MDDTQIVITMPESMSDEGRIAFRRAIAAIVTAFSQATIPEVITVENNEHKADKSMVGDTGLEPVTSSV